VQAKMVQWGRVMEVHAPGCNTATAGSQAGLLFAM
jgi:hypothetical protein